MSDPTGDLLVQVMAELGVDRHEDVLPALEKRFNALVTTRTSREENRTKRLEAEAEVARLRAAQVARRLEIVRPDDEHIEVWIGGREVASANHDEHGWSGMRDIEETARAVAKVLGAAVEETGDPTPKPWTYFIGFAAHRSDSHEVSSFGNHWIDRPHAVESADDVTDIEREIAQDYASGTVVKVISLQLFDSPEW